MRGCDRTIHDWHARQKDERQGESERVQKDNFDGERFGREEGSDKEGRESENSLREERKEGLAARERGRQTTIRMRGKVRVLWLVMANNAPRVTGTKNCSQK